MNNKIGNALKVLRNRAGLSQFQLELKARLSTSTITRIENGQINPTKESLLKLATVMALNKHETMYLLGVTIEPATQDEIDLAYQEVKDHFEKNSTLAYLIDERYRLVKVSKGFLKLLNFSDKDVSYGLLRSVVDLPINKNFTLRKQIDPKYYKSLLEFQLNRYYSEAAFIEDEIFQSTIEVINSDPLAKEVWDKVIESKGKMYADNNARIIHFKVGPASIGLAYSREPLKKYSRFEVIEYVPTNKVLKYLASKL